MSVIKTVLKAFAPRGATWILRAAAVTSCAQHATTLRRVRTFSVSYPLRQEKVTVHFITPSGERHTAEGKVGDSLLDVVVNNDVDLDGFGACEGELVCSTCHLIFKPDDYKKIPNAPCQDELDMLDTAFDLTDTSRLGCQIKLTKDMDGLEVHVPATVNDNRMV